RDATVTGVQTCALPILNITERRLPQDGRARIVVAGTEVDLRIATMPTMHGESAVIRLLRKGSGFVALDQIGLAARDDSILRNARSEERRGGKQRRAGRQ